MTAQPPPQPQDQQEQGLSLPVQRKVTPAGNRAEQVQAINGPGQRPAPPAPPVPIQASPVTSNMGSLFKTPNPLSNSGIGRNPASLPGLSPANANGSGYSATPMTGAGEASNRNNGQRAVDYLPTVTLPASNGGQLPDPPNLSNTRQYIDNLPAGQATAAPAQSQRMMSPVPASSMSPMPVLPASTPRPATMPPRENHQQQARAPQPPEVEGNNVILHRSPNFLVRTVYRQGQRSNPLHRPGGRTATMPKINPEQEKRIAASETKEMPSVTPINPVRVKAFPVPAWAEATVIILGLLVSLAAHAFNMFNFPRYELDEGTYMSNAWAILHGQISPYAYGYGHPPLAWIQIAAWIQVTGLFTFGNALNSGRVLMLFYAGGCSLLIYLIVRRLGGSRSAGLLAMVIFSLSPLSLTYQRQVLLDNVGTFWLLLSLYFLVVGNSRLLYIALAAVSFGIAFLSKEIFALFLPVMIYATWLHTTKFQRKFALVAFTYVAIAVCSMFVLMAILKGELFPTGWLPGDTHQHLSMIATYLGQAGRGQSQGGSVIDSVAAWTQADMVFMVLSVVATIFNLVAGWWKRKLLLLSLMSISFWVLLLRGGVVFPFYVIPLIPLVALNTAMAINTIMGWIGNLVRLDLVRALLIFGVIAAIIPYDAMNTSVIFTQHPTSAQDQALTWIHANVPTTDVIVINSYLYTDLHESGGAGVGGGEIYPHADVYQNVATDPAISQHVLQGNWDRIDYIVADSEMLQDIKANGSQMQIITDALNHSIERAEFRADDHSQQIVIQVFQVQHKIPPPVVKTSPETGNGSALAIHNTGSLEGIADRNRIYLALT